jgi:hypothetical protein
VHFSGYSIDCHAIYIITAVLKIETDIITSIAAIGLCDTSDNVCRDLQN